MTVLLGTCTAHALPTGELPKRLLVLPAGDTIRGKDGRAWSVKDRQAILAQLAQGPVLLDENHASVHATPRGERAPACGWLSDFKWTEAGLEAEVDWTPYGQERFSKKEYRYLSPTLTYSPVGATGIVLGTVTGLHSVGLVNTPNLDGLTALNSEKPKMTPEQLKALGLPENATQEQINARLAEVSKPQPALPATLVSELKDMFAGLVASLKPAAPAPATNTQGSTEPDAAADAIKIAVNTVVDAAVAAGKIAPASKDAFIKMGGSSKDSLAALQATVASLPQLVATNASTGTSQPKDQPKQLDANQLALCKAMNIKPEDFLASRSELG